MIDTEDEETNEANKELLIEQIAKKLKESGQKVDKQQIDNFLEELKKQQFSKAKTVEEKKALLKKMTDAFYEIGYISYYSHTQTIQATQSLALGVQAGSIQTLSEGLLTSTAWMTAAFVYTAHTGLNYRKYKKGQMTKKEFWSLAKMNSVTTVSSMAGGSGGAAAGFALGTTIMPGVGSIVGTIVGGLIGGYAGEKISSKAYKSIEQKIREAKEQRKLREMEDI